MARQPPGRVRWRRRKHMLEGAAASMWPSWLVSALLGGRRLLFSPKTEPGRRQVVHWLVLRC